MKRKRLTFEQRYPTKRARDLADAAIDKLPESEPMSAFIDTWFATYKASGGVEKRSDHG